VSGSQSSPQRTFLGQLELSRGRPIVSRKPQLSWTDASAPSGSGPGPGADVCWRGEHSPAPRKPPALL